VKAVWEEKVKLVVVQQFESARLWSQFSLKLSNSPLGGFHPLWEPLH